MNKRRAAHNWPLGSPQRQAEYSAFALGERAAGVRCASTTASTAVISISVRPRPPVLARPSPRRLGEVASIRSHRLSDGLSRRGVIPADG
jgi:hypothetical protein